MNVGSLFSFLKVWPHCNVLQGGQEVEGGLCVAGHRIGKVPPQAGVAAGGEGEVQDGCDCGHDGEDR